MRPVLFSIGNVHIYGYGLAMALAIILAVCMAEYRGKHYGIDKDFTFNCIVGAVIIGLIGAKVTYIITDFRNFAADPVNFIKENLASGFVVYGGILFGAAYAILYCRKKGVSILDFLDLAAPSIALGQGIGRIGCLLSGCCYGKETHSDWLYMVFPEGANAPAGVKLFPSQAISVVLDLAFCGILLLFAKRNRKKGHSGRVMALYMIGYSIGRSIIEIFRNDFRGSVGPLSTSQFISIFVLLGGILLYILCGRKDGAGRAAKGGTGKPALKYVLFDLDGTLTDPKEGITKSVQYALRHYGIEEDDLKSLEPFIGPPLGESFREFYGWNEEQCMEAILVYREYFSTKGIFENEMYAGIDTMLQHLKDAGLKLAVASSKPEEFVVKIMEHFGIAGYMDEMVGSCMDEKTRTTKEAVIEEALKRLNVTEADRAFTAMVGDRKYDINAGRQYGLKTVAVEYGFAQGDELQACGADMSAATVEELEQLLLR